MDDFVAADPTNQSIDPTVGVLESRPGRRVARFGAGDCYPGMPHIDDDTDARRYPADGQRARLQSSITLGGLEVACYVLDGRDRVIDLDPVLEFFSGPDGRPLGVLAGTNGLQEATKVISQESRTFTSCESDTLVRGITARGFLDICRALVKAMIRGELEVTGQLDAAVDCAAIISACADVGLIAMIDEATDYLRLQDSM